jgi:hypothetical protein
VGVVRCLQYVRSQMRFNAPFFFFLLLLTQDRYHAFVAQIWTTPVCEGPSTCLHGGVCQDTQAGFTCECPAAQPWQGTLRRHD